MDNVFKMIMVSRDRESGRYHEISNSDEEINNCLVQAASGYNNIIMFTYEQIKIKQVLNVKCTLSRFQD